MIRLFGRRSPALGSKAVVFDPETLEKDTYYYVVIVDGTRIKAARS